jgi:hypothetical protein
VAELSWMDGLCLGRRIQALLGLYVLWEVKCQECVGDCDDGWPTACIVINAVYSAPCIRCVTECELGYVQNIMYIVYI